VCLLTDIRKRFNFCYAAQNLYLAFDLMAISKDSLQLGMWNYVCTSLTHVQAFAYIPTVMNMGTMRNFQAIPDKFNVVAIMHINGVPHPYITLAALAIQTETFDRK